MPHHPCPCRRAGRAVAAAPPDDPPRWREVYVTRRGGPCLPAVGLARGRVRRNRLVRAAPAVCSPVEFAGPRGRHHAVSQPPELAPPAILARTLKLVWPLALTPANIAASAINLRPLVHMLRAVVRYVLKTAHAGWGGEGCSGRS